MANDKRYIWDAFISHASEDKREIARPLANLIAATGLRVWFDEGELSIGDSLREKIDHGLANSRFGILILSESFFSKKWPKAELDGIFSMEDEGEARVLPVWHGIGFDEIKTHSPILSGRLGARTSDGIEKVRNDIVRSIYKKSIGRRVDQPLFNGKLTKKVLMSAPEGSVFITNTINPDRTPTICVQLEDMEQREDLWQLIKLKEGAGRVCYIFQDWAGYRHHMSSRSIWTSEIEADQVCINSVPLHFTP